MNKPVTYFSFILLFVFFNYLSFQYGSKTSFASAYKIIINNTYNDINYQIKIATFLDKGEFGKAKNLVKHSINSDFENIIYLKNYEKDISMWNYVSNPIREYNSHSSFEVTIEDINNTKKKYNNENITN